MHIKKLSILIFFSGALIMLSMMSAVHFLGEINLIEMSWLWIIFLVGAILVQIGFTGIIWYLYSSINKTNKPSEYGIQAKTR